MIIIPTTVRADANPFIGGAITFASGTNVTLTQVGETITIASTGGGGGGSPGGSDTDVQYNSSGSFAGDSGFTYDGSGTVNLSNSIFVPTIHSPSNSNVIDMENALMIDTGGNNSIDWNNKWLQAGNVTTLDWVDFRTIDSSGSTVSMNWNDRTLSDSVGGLSLDWQSHHLQLGTSTTLDWENYLLQTSSGNISLNWNAGALGEISSGFTCILWSLRQLIASDASTVIMDWSNSTTTGLYNFVSGRLVGDGSGLTGLTAGAGGMDTNVQYNSSGSLAGNSDFTTDGAGNVNIVTNLTVPSVSLSGSSTAVNLSSQTLIDSSNASSVNWGNRQLLNGTNVSVDWASFLLRDNISNTSINWVDRQAYAADGISVTFDWMNRALLASNGQSMDWGNRVTMDSTGPQSINWDSRFLLASDGTTVMIDWSNSGTSGNYHFASGVFTGFGFNASSGGNITAAGSSANTFTWASSASAPNNSFPAAPVNYYGNDGTLMLGKPDAWALVNVNGTDYKMPLYS